MLHDTPMADPNLDPDTNLDVPNIDCEYYDQDQFLSTFCQADRSKSKLLHINARSLAKSISDIQHYLDILEDDFSIIGVSETWLKDINDPLVKLKGYAMEGFCRQHKRGGGVALYIKNDLTYKTRHDLSLNSDKFESCFVEIVNPTSGNIIVGTVYKPPDIVCSDFTDSFNDILAKVHNDRKKVYIMGDFNINLLLQETSRSVQDFINALASNSFFPLVNKPTRITPGSATLLDNIFTNEFSDHKTGILLTDISDHLPVFAVINKDSRIYSVKSNTHRREFSDNSIQHFIKDLIDTNWDFIKNTDSVNDSYSHFLQRIFYFYNTHFPMKEVHTRINRNKSPWLTEGIYRCIRRKNYLYSKYLDNPTLHKKHVYIQYKNILTGLIKRAKKNYLYLKFNSERNNIKGTWRLINSLLNKSKSNNNFPSYLVHNGAKIDDVNNIANSFNDYFVNIGNRIASNLPLSDCSYHSFLRDRCSHSLFLNPVTQAEIANMINKFPTGKAPGWDGLSYFVIKKARNALATPLALLFNQSISQGVFPDDLKIGKVVPIHKGGSRHDLINYRPITILSVFSKVFEKLMFSRLIAFVNKHGLLSQSQYGFRANRSTELAILDVLSKIIDAFENKQFSVGIFLDLSKAFDTVNHDILLNKLEHFGVRGLALDWFRSYISNRRQFVTFNSHNSLEKLITCGVPQGSVLGPLLFIIYVNDICYSSDLLSFCLFADDTNLIYNHHNVDTAIQHVNAELVKINSWLISNKLSINLLKTHYIVFCPRQHKYQGMFTLSIDGTKLSQVSSTKFLGLCMDENLTWNNHIDVLCGKISKNVGVMNRLKNFVPKNVLLTLYNSFVLSYLNYGLLSFGGSSSIHSINKLVVLQKKAVRIVNNAGFVEHTTPLFANSNILKLTDLYNHRLGVFMYKYTHNLLPQIFNNLFSFNFSIHSYGTRSSSKGNLFVRHNRTSLFKNSPFQRGVIFWNDLSSESKNYTNVASFAKNLKHKIIHSYV